MGLNRLIKEWQAHRRLENEIAAMPVGEIAGMGLTRQDLRATARMPPEQIARMERMASVFGLPEGWQGADPALAADVSRTCANCSANSTCRHVMADLDDADLRELAGFCPNAGTYAAMTGA